MWSDGRHGVQNRLRVCLTIFDVRFKMKTHQAMYSAHYILFYNICSKQVFFHTSKYDSLDFNTYLALSERCRSGALRHTNKLHVNMDGKLLVVALVNPREFQVIVVSDNVLA